ncbi:hypothetical protein PDE_00031 [Penicillium oxalicum 114-2]|uniref:Uncharacterized protein n=1 Tax=Penicillium oxalicum (strain 114-2 / CGMCC 5302) TaxID=933388 RepID=S7Z3K3_PENO1|nr:hypothetical protein PDE_00031 [Penicillium oxalicum 114-2]
MASTNEPTGGKLNRENFNGGAKARRARARDTNLIRRPRQAEEELHMAGGGGCPSSGAELTGVQKKVTDRSQSSPERMLRSEYQRPFDATMTHARRGDSDGEVQKPLSAINCKQNIRCSVERGEESRNKARTNAKRHGAAMRKRRYVKRCERTV